MENPLLVAKAGPLAVGYGAAAVMFLPLLRTRTAELHRRIERASPLLRPDLTRTKYGEYLRAVLGYMAPVAERLAGAATTTAERDRLPFRCDGLRRDLAALGVEAEPALCSALPPVHDRAGVLGCLYVLEGSTLGGRVLLPIVGPRLGVDARAGARFLAGHGADTDSRWAALCEDIEDHAETRPGDAEPVIASALTTFATFGAWIARQVPA